MDFAIKERINDLINNGYNFKFGDYISEGFRIVQKNIGLFVGYTVIYFLMSSVMGSIPVIGSLASIVISPVLMAGFYIVAHKVQNNREAEFSNFFDGFKDFKEIAIAAVMITLITVGLFVVPFLLIVGVDNLMGIFNAYQEFISTADPYVFEGVFDIFKERWWLIFLGMIPAIYFSISYYWTYLFIIFYKLPAWEAMEASRKTVTKNWGIIFLFLFVVGLIGGMGIILLFIGILFTIPVMTSAIYASFADVTKLNYAEDHDISEHLVD